MLFSSLVSGLVLAGFAHAAPKPSSTCNLVVATHGLQLPQNCGTYGSVDETLVEIIDTQSTKVGLEPIVRICH